MMNNGSEWSNTLVHLLALAAKLEGEGQYNNVLSVAGRDPNSTEALLNPL